MLLRYAMCRTTTALVISTMIDESLLDDIRQLNLSYLMLVQRMIRDDRTLAIFRLKLTPAMADALVAAPLSQLAKLANSNQLLCQLTIQDTASFNRLVEETPHEDVQRTHTALLLAGKQHVAPQPAQAEIHHG